MSVPIDAKEKLISAALRVVQTEYLPASDPTGDWEAEFADEQLALAARDFVQAVEAQDPKDRPVGWSGKETG